jgi:hypothetical protein
MALKNHFLEFIRFSIEFGERVTANLKLSRIFTQQRLQSPDYELAQG